MRTLLLLVYAIGTAAFPVLMFLRIIDHALWSGELFITGPDAWTWTAALYVTLPGALGVGMGTASLLERLTRGPSVALHIAPDRARPRA